jgi:hypothetical protein
MKQSSESEHCKVFHFTYDGYLGCAKPPFHPGDHIDENGDTWERDRAKVY